MANDWLAAVRRYVPPPEQLEHTLSASLGPAAGAALVVFTLGILLFGRRSALAVAPIALIVGVALANAMPAIRPGPEVARSLWDAHAQFPWWPVTPGESWMWIPLLFVLALGHGAVSGSCGTSALGAWFLRVSTGLLTAIVLVPPNLHANWPAPFTAKVWPIVAFALVVAVGWAGLQAVCRKSPGGAVGLGMASAMLGASLVVAHAHSGRFSEMLAIPGTALLGVSLVSLVRRCDLSGAMGGMAFLLPALLLVTFDQTFSEIPGYSFALAGAAPVAVGLMAIPPLSRLQGFWRWLAFWVLCLAPTIAAVVITVRVETLIEDF